MKKKLKAGVIGLGVGRQHLKAYLESKHIDNDVAICDFDKIKLSKIKKEFNLKNNIFTEWKQLLDLNLDIISICTYDNYHYKQIKAFLGKGTHIFVEKPMVLEKKHLIQIKKLISKKKVIIYSNLILRKYPRFIYIKKLIKSQSIGRIFAIDCGYIHFIKDKLENGWRGKISNYSTILGGGIHLIDLVTWLIGKLPNKVFSMSNKLSLEKKKKKLNDDTTFTLLKYKDGMICRCLSSFSLIHPKLHHLKIYGTKGTIENTNEAIKIYMKNKKKDKVIKINYPGVTKGAMIEDFINQINKKNFNKKNFKDISDTLDICFSALNSIKNNKVNKIKYIF